MYIIWYYVYYIILCILYVHLSPELDALHVTSHATHVTNHAAQCTCY